MIYYLLPITHYPLSITHFLLPITYYLLPITYYLLEHYVENDKINNVAQILSFSRQIITNKDFQDHSLGVADRYGHE